jgi:hypothetical protein
MPRSSPSTALHVRLILSQRHDRQQPHEMSLTEQLVHSSAGSHHSCRQAAAAHLTSRYLVSFHTGSPVAGTGALLAWLSPTLSSTNTVLLSFGWQLLARLISTCQVSADVPVSWWSVRRPAQVVSEEACTGTPLRERCLCSIGIRLYWPD